MAQVLAFCFGGFLFYAGVVVPIGTRVLGATTQGFVTREVTRVLNLAMLVCIAGIAWEIWAGRLDRSAAASRALTALAVLIAITCGILWWIHGQLDAQLSADEFAVNDPSAFYGMHRLYLWVSTLQWLCSLPVVWIIANSRLDVSQTKRM